MQDGDDWAGVFFRGDDAFFFAVMAGRALVTVDDIMTRAAIQGFIHDLKSCIEGDADRAATFQRLKAYSECVEDSE